MIVLFESAVWYSSFGRNLQHMDGYHVVYIEQVHGYSTTRVHRAHVRTRRMVVEQIFMQNV